MDQIFFKKTLPLAYPLLVLAVSFTLTGCGHAESQDGNAANKVAQIKDGSSLIKLPPDSVNKIGLQYAQADVRPLDIYVTIPGEVQANNVFVTHVTGPVTGRVQDVLANIGDFVHANQTLIIIRSQDIEQAESDLLQNVAQIQCDEKKDLMQNDLDIQTAEAQLKMSEAEFARQKTLMDEKIASRATYEQTRTQYEKDKINFEALKGKRQATISLAEEKIDLAREGTRQKLRILGVPENTIKVVMDSRRIDPNVTIASPKDGVVTERGVNQGELTDPGKSLFTIADLNSVWLSANVYEKDIEKVRVGQPIELEIDSLPGEIFRGRLNFVSESIAQDTRTLAVRAEVPNPGWKLKPDMFGTMKILVGQQPTLTVPIGALQDAGDRQVVYVPVGNGTFEERPVEIGAKTKDYVEVLHGIHAGERVVSGGSFTLRSASLQQSN